MEERPFRAASERRDERGFSPRVLLTAVRSPHKKTERGYAALLMLRPLDFLFSDSGGVCGHLYGPPERDVRALSSGQLF